MAALFCPSQGLREAFPSFSKGGAGVVCQRCPNRFSNEGFGLCRRKIGDVIVDIPPLTPPLEKEGNGLRQKKNRMIIRNYPMVCTPL